MTSDEIPVSPASINPSEPVHNAVPLHLPWYAQVYHGFAFFLSAILSPYIVIPVGTVGIVYLRSPREHALQWTLISVAFSTVLPVLFVVVQVLRGKITDIHVMEREQRGGPFMVAIVSSLLSALVLWYLNAYTSVWGLSLILAINGAILFGITFVYKISMHVSVLAATVLAAIVFHPGLSPWPFLVLIPLLIWARSARKRHTVWQGLAGCAIASIITGITLMFLGMGERILQMLERATPGI